MLPLTRLMRGYSTTSVATPAIPVISSKQRTEPDLRVSTALVTATANLFGAWEQVSGTGFLFTAPEIVWEAFLGIYMTFRGFREDSPLLRRSPGQPPAMEDPLFAR